MAVKILVSLGFPPIIWSRRSAPSPGLFPAPTGLGRTAKRTAPVTGVCSSRPPRPPPLSSCEARGEVLKTDSLHVVHARAAGLDVHKMQITASVRICAAGGETRVETRTFDALASGLDEMIAWMRVCSLPMPQ